MPYRRRLPHGWFPGRSPINYGAPIDGGAGILPEQEGNLGHVGGNARPQDGFTPCDEARNPYRKQRDAHPCLPRPERVGDTAGGDTPRHWWQPALPQTARPVGSPNSVQLVIRTTSCATGCRVPAYSPESEKPLGEVRPNSSSRRPKAGGRRRSAALPGRSRAACAADPRALRSPDRSPRRRAC